MSIDPAELSEALREVSLGQCPEAVELSFGDPLAIRTTVEGVLAPIMRAIGDRWEAGLLSIDDARVAIETVDEALELLWRAAEEFVSSRGPHVAVACVPGEWHTLPARMAAITMRCEGCNVATIGASVSTDALAVYARRERPLALAFSATISSRLIDTFAAIDAVHRVGVPVIAGGAAFGTDGARAQALGADAWCRDAAEAAHILRAWERHAPHVDPKPSTDAQNLFTEAVRAGIVDTALRTRLRAEQESGEVRTESDNHRAGLELAALLTFTEVAVLTGDDRVLTEGVAWWGRRIAAERADPSMPAVSIDALIHALRPGPRRALLLRTRSELGAASSHRDEGDEYIRADAKGAGGADFTLTE